MPTFEMLVARFVLLSCTLCLLLAGCGVKAKQGEACTKRADCGQGLVCLNGACEGLAVSEASSDDEEGDEAAGDDDEEDETSKARSGRSSWEVFRVSRDKKDPFLNVRAKRKSRSKLLAKLPEGTRVKVRQTKGKWREIDIKSGDDAGKSGWVHICCVKPKGADDLYWARLGPWDHSNSRGTPVESAAGIVRQDRANYHKFEQRDSDDRHDLTFDDKGKRAWLSKALRDSLDEETRRIIQKRQPLVEVVVWDDRAELTVIEKGPKHNMTYDEAFELCGRRYCKCARGKGKCKGKRYEKCMEARGHMTAADLCGDQF